MELVKIVHEDQIQLRIKELALQLANDYHQKNPILIGVLKGSFMFLSDLIRNLGENCSPEVDFMEVSSYGAGKESSGTIRIHKDLAREIHDRHVIIVEDVLDSGLTLNYLFQSLKIRGPKSLAVCTLVEKDIERNSKIVKPKYVGFHLPNEFIVGFGMDYAERYRELPYIAKLV